MMRLFFVVIALACLAAGPLACGNAPEEDEENCAKFSSYQIYPEFGTGQTEYELLVVLKEKKVNRSIDKIEAALFHSDGSNAQKVWGLVQSSADPYRYISNSFFGNEICEDATCFYYFQVIAYHDDGCIKGFDTEVFVVDMTDSEPQDDDDDAS